MIPLVLILGRCAEKVFSFSKLRAHGYTNLFLPGAATSVTVPSMTNLRFGELLYEADLSASCTLT